MDATKMRVFISWSGARSKKVALALHTFISDVLQATDPWVSDRDIAAGSKWDTAISVELGSARFGVVCVTPENQTSSWLNFEAGALAHAFSRERVCPFAFDMSVTDIKPPLGQFNACAATKDGARRLIEAINRVLGEQGLLPKSLDRTFERCWPDLARDLDAVESDEPIAPSPRSERELLEEILEIVRQQQDPNPLNRALAARYGMRGGNRFMDALRSTLDNAESLPLGEPDGPGNEAA